MNAYAAVDAAHFAELDRAQAREAALERFQMDWEEAITREARLKSFREVDELMDEVMEEIANDPLKNLKFGRALFALWAGWPEIANCATSSCTRSTASSNATLKANRQANTGRLYEVKRDEVPVH